MSRGGREAGPSPARVAAWRALLRLRSSRGRADDSVEALPELEGLSERDRALANELVMGTIKRRRSLDTVLGAFTKAPLTASDPRVLGALRLAAYQLLYLDRVPAYAAVDDAVETVAAVAPRSRGFVNAVLRKVAAKGRGCLDEMSAGEDSRAWSIRHSYPVWIVDLARRELGDEHAVALLEAGNAPPERCVRVNALIAGAEAAQTALAKAGFETSGVPGLPGALVYDGPALERSAPFRDGLVTAQSRGSQIAGLVAATAPAARAGATRVLDLCAAPGTKSGQLAAALPHVQLTVVDSDAARVEALRANLARLGVTARVMNADALDLGAEHDAVYDVVLLDAPCSGLGTFASRPDLRWRRREADVGRLADLQRRLLARAAGCVRPGGALVYAVCTFPRAETLGVVESLTARGGWKLDDLGEAWPGLAHPRAGGCLLVLPPNMGTTGFFVARLRRDD